MKLLKRWMMSCQDVAASATEYLDRQLKVRKKAAVFTHLLTCPACLRYIRQLKKIIRAAKSKHPPESLPPHLAKKLHKTFSTWQKRKEIRKRSPSC